MALDGLCLPKFLGWITGLLFVRKPWGDYVFTSYLHPYTIFALSINIVFGLLWKDFYSAFYPTLKGQPLTRKLLSLSGTAGFHFFYAYTRWVYLLSAKRMSRLVQSLTKTLNGIKPSGRVWFWGVRSLWFLLLFQTGLALTYACSFYQTSQSDDQAVSQSSIFFPRQKRPWWYFIIFFSLATFPVAISIYFTFGFIFILTLGILRVFDEFCKSVADIYGSDCNLLQRSGVNQQEHEQRRKNSDTFIINMMDHTESNMNTSDADLSVAIIRDRFRAADTSDSSMLEMKAELLERFEKVKDIFDQYDMIVGPLLLGMLVRNVFVVINDVTAIVINWNPYKFDVVKGCNVLNLCGDLAQFCVLELGSWAHRRVM